MMWEEKELLLKDLCARLPYGVKCQFIWTYNNETTDGEDVIANDDDNIRCIDIHTKEILSDYYGGWVDLEHCKPYLRPLSSMTEEEENEYRNIIVCPINRQWDVVDWLNKKMFDYHGLIDKGLAIEVTEENNPYKCIN